MPRPQNMVDEIRNAAIGVLNAMDAFDRARKRYFALGGTASIAPYFVQADPDNPGQTIARTDLDITQDDVTGVINSGDAINDLLATGHRTNLAKATR